MHSAFRSSLNHDQVGAGKVRSMMEGKKEVIAIVLARAVVYPKQNVAVCIEKEMKVINI